MAEVPNDWFLMFGDPDSLARIHRAFPIGMRVIATEQLTSIWPEVKPGTPGDVLRHNPMDGIELEVKFDGYDIEVTCGENDVKPALLA